MAALDEVRAQRQAVTAMKRKLRVKSKELKVTLKVDKALQWMREATAAKLQVNSGRLCDEVQFWHCVGTQAGSTAQLHEGRRLQKIHEARQRGKPRARDYAASCTAAAGIGCHRASHFELELANMAAEGTAPLGVEPEGEGAVLSGGGMSDGRSAWLGTE